MSLRRHVISLSFTCPKSDYAFIGFVVYDHVMHLITAALRYIDYFTGQWILNTDTILDILKK